MKKGNRHQAIGNSRIAKTIGFAGFALCAILVALCGSAAAQQPKKVPRVGIVTAQPLSAIAVRHEAFRQGLRELGYLEGKNIVIEHLSAEGKFDRLPALMAEIVRLKVDVIISHGPTTTRAAKEATSTIPIVMAQDPDPIGNGFVVSLASPGSNITGLSSLTSDLNGKRLELLKESLPKLSRMAVFGTSTNQGNTQSQKETEVAAGALGVNLQYLDVVGPKDIDTAFLAAGNGRTDAVFVLRSPVLNSQRIRITQLAAKRRLPAMYPISEYVRDGGLMSYDANSNDLARRAATYVDKILKGAKPAELPVEQPTKFEFIINLKAAKQIGLTIPPNVLARADRVIR
jgi:putative tryptophan/tyrosine transport system substrate-binding protein